MQTGEHHTREGLTFRRNDDGSIRVRVYPGANDSLPPSLDVTLTQAEWESVEREISWASIHNRPADRGETS